jgi:hypothetical protein
MVIKFGFGEMSRILDLRMDSGTPVFWLTFVRMDIASSDKNVVRMLVSQISQKGKGIMKLSDYITKDEVKRICKELKIRDWTTLKRAKVQLKEAKTLLALVNTGKMAIDPEQFRIGLEVELEHGIRFQDANVTNNHPVITGMIVLAHMKESLAYYKLLEVAELEGDLMKAIATDNTKKTKDYYNRLAQAKITLAKAEIAQMK